MSDWAGLFAAARHGVVHVGDGRRFGISEDAVRARARREGWRRLHPRHGVLGLPWAAEGFEQDVAAALAAVGPHALAARRSALRMHGVVVFAPPIVDVVVAHNHRAPDLGRGVRVTRSRTLLPQDATTAGGLPATSLPRTVLDLAAMWPTPRLRDVLIDGCQQGAIDLGEVAQRRAAARRPRGRHRLDAALRQVATGRVDSGFEWDVRRLVQSHGLHPHPAPFPFRCPDGVVVHLDIAFPAAWHAIECDGRAFHSDRRAFETDRTRWSQIQQGGWTLTWVTRDRLQRDPAGIVAEVRTAIERADPARPRARPTLPCGRGCCR